MIAQPTPELNSLNAPQEEAVRTPDRPLLIVAGAGTGKTRTLTMRILHLLERGVPPGAICALTFTNKAAREIEERVLKGYKALGGRWPAGETPFLGTFHSFGARVLRKEGRLIGRTADFVIHDDGDGGSVIKKVMRSLGAGELAKVRGRERGPAFFADQISKIKNGMLSLDELKDPEDMPGMQDGNRGEFIKALFEEYEKEMERQNAFDFDDLIQKVVAIFKKHPEVLAKYHNRFTHFLVDEYQDVNNMQYEMVRALAAPTGNISVVGDDQQTIYSWRGSNFEIFLNFERDWPGAHVVVLDQNYRSSQNIINAASSLISNNKKQKPKTLWTANDPGDKVRLIACFDDEDEAEWVATDIGRNYASTAILYRTNAQSRAIEQSLLRRSIPYRVYGGLKFYERKEIRDIVAALRLAQNPQDGASKERLEKNLTKTRYAKYAAAIAETPSRIPTEVIKIFLASTGYAELVERTLTNALDRNENILALIQFASRFDDLGPMVEEISLVQATDAAADKRNRGGAEVELMTVHLAKGLEFDSVYIVGVNEGLLPHARATNDQAELEEERRLMYVAMTRARKRLTISFSDLPSRFLSEVPEQFIDFVNRTSGRSGSIMSDHGRQSGYGRSGQSGAARGQGRDREGFGLSDFLDDEENYITLD
jgi:DNA helicase II / ATP-dependent DNA helicase PcrA